MAVQLLPFQKVADIPDVAQRHRRAICGLAVTSIVLISLILCLFIAASLFSASINYFSNLLLVIFGVPSMIIVFVLVLVSSIISLRNTDKWRPSDSCCNLMRSQPACCTKSCGGNKHCCARLSCAYIAASVLTSLFFVVFVAVLYAGCSAANSTKCFVSSILDVPAIILLLSLVATTATSAYLLRQVENAQPGIALLPPGKMVTHDVAGYTMMTQAAVVNDAYLIDDKTKTELESEQSF